MMQIRLIEPEVHILTPINESFLRMIEVAGRTCYKSEYKIDADSHQDYYNTVCNVKSHHSVAEHVSFSVRIIADRGVLNEVVRHRIASYSQESTRYCNYTKEKFKSEMQFIKPFWLDSTSHSARVEFINVLQTCANAYEWNIKCGWTAQQARDMLPLSLKSEVVMTANIRSWLNFFKLRTECPAAHPQMRQIAIPLLQYCQQALPSVFGHIKIKEDDPVLPFLAKVEEVFTIDNKNY